MQLLDMSSIFSGNRVAMNLLCVKLETAWALFVVFGRFSVWTKTVAIVNNFIYIFFIYGMFKLTEYWKWARCKIVHLLQGK